MRVVFMGTPDFAVPSLELQLKSMNFWQWLLSLTGSEIAAKTLNFHQSKTERWRMMCRSISLKSEHF